MFFPCIEIEWKVLYVGSSKDESYDQELESFSMGPLDSGVMQFDIEVSNLFSLKFYWVL